MHLRHIIVDYLHVMQNFFIVMHLISHTLCQGHSVVSYRRIPWLPHLGKLSSTNLGIMIGKLIGPSILIYQEIELCYAIYVHLCYAYHKIIATQTLEQILTLRFSYL